MKRFWFLLLPITLISCKAFDTLKPQKSGKKQEEPTTSSTTTTVTTTLTITTTTQASIIEIGVNAHIHSGDGIRLMREMGAKWIRFDIPWAMIETSDDNLNWTFMDAAIKEAIDKEFKIMASISMTPSWASSNGDPNGVPNLRAWEDFVKRAVSRYQDSVSLWGIWNEPNLERFWVGSTNDYIEILLKPASRIIHQLDPNNLVGGPELAFLGSSARIDPLDFLKELKSSDGDDHLDVLTQHAYGSDHNKFIEKMEGVKLGDVVVKDGIQQILEKSGLFGMPFFLTEYGYRSNEVGNGKQAQYLEESTQYLSNLGWVNMAVIYELHDDPNIPEKWGILKDDLKTKPAFQRLKKLLSP